MRKDLDILILGAGIGGLAAATALAQRGAQVRVIERAPQITEAGAGIQISPNGARILERLGLPVPGLRSGAVQLIDGLGGGSLLRMALPRDGAGFWLCHRVDLINALAQAARAAGVQVTLGETVAQVTPGDAPVVRLATGAEVSAQVVIGADGLHSVARQAVLGPTQPFFTQQVAWRAMVPGDGQDHPPEARVYTGPGAHVVTYPLREGALINIVAVEEQTEWAQDGWSHIGDPAALRAAFSGFCSEITALLAQVDQVHRWGLFRHPIAPRWFCGATALLGDAAHPTLPFLAQGAVMALEDAWVLATCLDHAPTAQALARYQALRLPRVTRIIAAANANARNYHLRGVQRWGANHALRLLDRAAPQRMLTRFAWLYDHDVTTSAL